jgi:hypothetical protein
MVDSRAGNEGMFRCDRSNRSLWARWLGPGARIALAGFAQILTSISQCAATSPEDQSQALPDLSRFTVQETVLYLTNTNPKTSSTQSHAYISDSEIDYRATDWYQLALMMPTSLSGGAGIPGSAGTKASWNGVLVSNLFLQPHADTRTVFFGASLQFASMAPGAAFPALADTNSRFAIGFTPIVGFHYSGSELLISPTVAFGIGPDATTSLAPAARLTHKVTATVDVGIEYAGSLGQATKFSPLNQQSQILYGITDFQFAGFGFNVGVGYGLTAASRGLTFKIGVAHSL